MDDSAPCRELQRFRTLLVGHDPADPPEATLALAAAAALGGLRADGAPMPGAEHARPASLATIARELGLDVKAVRRGVAHLEARGAVRRDGAGVVVHAAALAARWADPRRRIRLPAELRAKRLRAGPLLLAGLGLGQLDQRGQLRLGVGLLAERLGLPRRTVQRCLASCESAGVLHRWIAPIRGGRLVLAPGPAQSGARRPARSGARRGDQPADQPEVAHPAVPKRRVDQPEVAHPPSRSGARISEVHPELGSPSGRARARDPEPPAAAGEPRATDSAAAAPAARPAPGPDQATIRSAIEQWVADLTRRRVERLDAHDPRHVAAIAGLLDRIGPAPDMPAPDTIEGRRRRSALHADRLALAGRVARWCPSPERLGRWLARVLRWFGVRNLGAYLRRAAERGDPGAVLEGGTKRRVGRGAERWRDFSRETERALEGEHVDDVQRLVGGVAAVLAADDPGERAALRAQLADMLAQGRRVAARAALLQLVGNKRDDVTLARAVDGICTVAVAREVLAA